MNPLSSELPFHVHNWLIISLKDFCIVIRKWPTIWPSKPTKQFERNRHRNRYRLLTSLQAGGAVLKPQVKYIPTPDTVGAV